MGQHARGRRALRHEPRRQSARWHLHRGRRARMCRTDMHGTGVQRAWHGSGHGSGYYGWCRSFCGRLILVGDARVRLTPARVARVEVHVLEVVVVFILVLVLFFFLIAPSLPLAFYLLSCKQADFSIIYLSSFFHHHHPHHASYCVPHTFYSIRCCSCSFFYLIKKLSK